VSDEVVPSPEEVWTRYDADEARLSAPLSARMLDLARLGRGHHVLDLATGRGEPAIAAAQRVAPEGRVLGVDVDASMLAMARARADREGVTNLELRAMSAESLDGVPSAAFDAVLVRWGLMYLRDPVAALAESRRALRPGGLFVAAVWGPPERVSYFSFPRQILHKYSPQPAISTEIPGTFYYSEPEKLARDLARAGLELVHEEELELAVMEAETPDGLVRWTRAFGMTKLLNGLPEAVQRAWEDDVRREAERLCAGGVYRLGGVTRVVVATPRATALDGSASGAP
jgi:ubiquinone/menaquinone biosynthesis C-methylase UbiE